MPINIISKIKPKNDGYFPVFEDRDIIGGYQVRSDLTDRNNIPSLNRKEGMLVYTQSDAKYYTLSGGLTDGYWTEVIFGGSFQDFILVNTIIPYEVVDITNQFISVGVFGYDIGLPITLTITLPLNPVDGQEIIVKDTFGTCGIGELGGRLSIVIYGNGTYIITNETYFLFTEFECVHLKYNSSLGGWHLVSEYPS